MSRRRLGRRYRNEHGMEFGVIFRASKKTFGGHWIRSGVLIFGVGMIPIGTFDDSLMI